MKLQSKIETLRHSFLGRLVAIFLLAASAVALLVCSLYIFTEIREDRRHNEAMARLTAMSLAESVRLPLFSGNREELANLARFAIARPGIRRATILDGTGRVLVDLQKTGASPSGTLLPLSVPVRRNPSGASPERVLTGEGGVGETLLGAIRVEYETVRLSRQARDAALFAGAAAFLFLLLVSAVSYPVLRRAMRSFDGLLRGIGAIREGEYDRLLPVDSGSELGLAAANVNELATALKTRDAENRKLHLALEDEIRVRAAAEAEAREGERTLRELLDAMPAGIAWTDLAGNVQFMNQYTIESFGYEYGEIRTVDDWFIRAYPDPEARRQALAAKNAAIGAARKRGADVATYEGQVTCRDGSVKRIIFRSQVRKERVVVTLLDITEREAMQERIIRIQKMETLGVLAGGIAHNFNNALTSILGYVSFARRKLDNPAKARELLDKAENASRAAAGIAAQLLTFARGGEPVKAPISVGKVLEDAVSLALVGTRVGASIEIPPGLRGIEADEGQLGQVFNNLLINAVQAMPDGGKIAIRCENVGSSASPACLPPGEYVRIAISDPGCGIPEEMREKIFDPYFTTKAGVGSGLGLASVRSIVERHGGVITVQSEVGCGTTFTLHLPSIGSVLPDDRTGPERPSPARGNGRSILFLDDEELIRVLARETLEYFGYRVTACEHGDAAVDLYREAKMNGTPFSAAILDLTLPAGPDGRVVAERILAFDPEAVLVVSSGYSNNPVMADYRNYGFRAAVPKPYRDDALIRTLGELLDDGVGAG